MRLLKTPGGAEWRAGKLQHEYLSFVACIFVYSDTFWRPLPQELYWFLNNSPICFSYFATFFVKKTKTKNHWHKTFFLVKSLLEIKNSGTSKDDPSTELLTQKSKRFTIFEHCTALSTKNVKLGYGLNFLCLHVLFYLMQNTKMLFIVWLQFVCE